MLTNLRINARIEAMQKCIDHLALSWTEDEIEMQEAKIVQELLQKEIERLEARLQRNIQKTW